MHPKYLKVTDVEASPIFIPDTFANPFSVALGVKITGSVSYTVEYTFDNTLSDTFNPVSATWFKHPNLTDETAAKDSNIAYPVMGIRLVGSLVGGTATLAIIQAGA